jgi:hypothetical protein
MVLVIFGYPFLKIYKDIKDKGYKGGSGKWFVGD